MRFPVTLGGMAFALDPRYPAGNETIRAAREMLAESGHAARRREATPGVRIHGARTAAKRARSAVKLLRGTDRAEYREENRRLRAALLTLSELRDADATPASLQDLVRHYQRALPPGKFDPLMRAFRASSGSTAESRKLAEAALAEFLALLEEVDARLSRWIPNSDPAVILDEHRRAYRRARAGLTGAKELGTAKAFHAWRKAVKVYLHQCQLLREAWPPVMKAQRKELKHLNRILGDEHDLSVLRKDLRQRRAKGGLDIVDEETFATAIQLIEARREELRAVALPLGERLFADRPRAVMARMSQWWRVAQELACALPPAAPLALATAESAAG